MDMPKPRLGILEFTQSVLGIHPYPWQRTTLVHIEAGHPTALTACNGAGETSTILVTAALWCLFNWPRGRVIVTSASWSQLKKQFFDTIRLQARQPLFRSHIFNEAEVRTPEGGFVIGLSVDEAGKAEGYHERPDSPVMILADEAKSIHDDVFTSLARCTATWRVYASSAGPACGTFYSCLTTFRNFWACVLVKSSECPHISKESIEIDRQMWGEHSPQFRQKHLAEFTAEDEEAFISMETVRACMDNPPVFSAGRSSTFIDWSTGEDETVIATANGNRLQIVAAFRERSRRKANHFSAWLMFSLGLLKHHGFEAVKKYGGRSFAKKGEALVLPQVQTPKGSIVLAGALCATTIDFLDRDAAGWISAGGTDDHGTSFLDLPGAYPCA
jgi:hypothetical protein